MQEFRAELERIVKKWPENSRWTVGQVAAYTRQDDRDVCKWFGSFLKRTLDTQDLLSVMEAEQVISAMLDLESSGDRLEEFKEDPDQLQAMALLQQQKKQQLVLEKGKDWQQAFKNLNYFFGQYGQKLPLSEKLAVMGDCLRLGIKASFPPQELIRFLRGAVSESLEGHSLQGLREALDFVDTYGDYFLSGKNQSVLESLLENCAVVARDHQNLNLVSEVKQSLGLS